MGKLYKLLAETLVPIVEAMARCEVPSFLAQDAAGDSFLPPSEGFLPPGEFAELYEPSAAFVKTEAEGRSGTIDGHSDPFSRLSGDMVRVTDRIAWGINEPDLKDCGTLLSAMVELSNILEGACDDISTARLLSELSASEGRQKAVNLLTTALRLTLLDRVRTAQLIFSRAVADDVCANLAEQCVGSADILDEILSVRVPHLASEWGPHIGALVGGLNHLSGLSEFAPRFSKFEPFLASETHAIILDAPNVRVKDEQHEAQAQSGMAALRALAESIDHFANLARVTNRLD